jgi:hypothetical protein
VPVPEIATRLAGFFELPLVAYVQSKQTFFLPEGDPFYNADQIFYETLQLSNDQANAVISCGSGVMYRRQALEELGGFVTWNIVEDCTTSYDLPSRGRRAAFIILPFPAGAGYPDWGLPPAPSGAWMPCACSFGIILLKAGLVGGKSHFPSSVEPWPPAWCPSSRSPRTLLLRQSMLLGHEGAIAA